MQLLINRKIYFYLLILILLVSINNKNFLEFKFLKLNDVTVSGLSEKENDNLQSKLNRFENQNIFFINANKILEILELENLIESFNVFKIYPSKINIQIKRAELLANISFDSKNFLIGSNKRLIESDVINPDLPLIFGEPPVENFFKIKKKIELSSFDFSNIKKLYFFPSERWDVELKNGILIKLPNLNTLLALNDVFEMMKFEKFEKIKIFDLRVNGQMITNEL
tara:strand:+ start:9209 stop:9883 length:675 start_codon:yes stop_codon:yes gene_type:complete